MIHATARPITAMATPNLSMSVFPHADRTRRGVRDAVESSRRNRCTTNIGWHIEAVVGDVRRSGGVAREQERSSTESRGNDGGAAGVDWSNPHVVSRADVA